MKQKMQLLEQPAGEVWKKIRVELNEDVASNDMYLATIKEWLKKQPHLPNEFDDQSIMTFLRGCSFSVEKCKNKIDMYFTMRAACPDLYAGRDPKDAELQRILGMAQGPALPQVTPNGRRVTIMRGITNNFETEELTKCLKLALMVGDIRLMEEKEGVGGDIVVIDGKNLGATLMKMSPSVLKKFMICIQEAMPVKLKEIHVVNTSALVEKFVNFIKTFLKEKIRNRMFIHKDVTGLHDYIPREMLPPEYGGEGPTMDALQELWIAKLLEYRDWFLENENLKADEALRPGKPKNYDELFGIDGSFRQLAID